MVHERTLGPFTGRQLTTIVVALCATVVLLPAAAWGVAKAKEVVIRDGTNAASRATVSGGKLGVGDGAGALTVDGKTRSAALDPTDLYTEAQFSLGSCLEFRPPPGSALVITSVSESSSNPLSVDLYRGPAPTGACGTEFTRVRKNVTWLVARETHEVPFPSGLVIPDGEVLTATFPVTTGANSHAVWISVNGYLRPNADCPTAADCLKGG
jgi:hypothetical protein